MVMFDSLNRRMLSTYGCQDIKTPNFDRLAAHSVTFDNCYIGSMPCMPARRELHTGRYNFMHRSWGPLEPFDDSMPEILGKNGIYTHLVSDHQHYWEDGGCTYHTRYNSWEISRGQEGDLWKGHVKDPDMSGYKGEKDNAAKAAMKEAGIQDLNRQDAVNRLYLQQEENMPQAVTFRNGLEFIRQNHQEDNWFLQIETFDPHEPFFASERFREMYPDPDYTGKEFDWPPYDRVKESPEEVEHCRKRYKALVSMCDYYLGTVLDAMDEYGLWEDTMLLVNTDHGFLLGEHGWWAKSIMPYYNEIAHIPMFLWDPRSGVKGERRSALVQNIDVAPTILEYFGLEPTKDMMGKSLKETVISDEPVRQYALFGSHGNHINITDGTYIYMRCPGLGETVYEYTLMPTHMRNRFSVQELQRAELNAGFSFTKGCPVLKVPATGNPFADPARFGSQLYDVSKDPRQLSPLQDEKKEAELAEEIRKLMIANEAPEELYHVFGLEKDQVFTVEDLRREKEQENNIHFPGLENYVIGRIPFIQLRTLMMLMPPEQAESLKGAMDQQLAAAGCKEITGEFILGFLQGLPFPEEMKKKLLSMLEGIAQQ